MKTLFIRQYFSNDQNQVYALHQAALKPTGAYLNNQKFDQDLFDIEAVYLQTGGEFLVGLLDAKIVAMGALKVISATRAEIKRMRVHPDYQRQGFGQMILDELQKRAKDKGFKVLCLDTTNVQSTAQKFYLENGYREVGRAAMNDSGQLSMELIFYEKNLKSK